MIRDKIIRIIFSNCILFILLLIDYVIIHYVKIAHVIY